MSTMQGVCWNPTGKEIWYTGGIRNRHYLYAVDLSGKERLIFESLGEITIRHVSPNGEVLITSEFRHRETRGLAPGSDQESDLSWFDFSLPADLTDDGKTFLFEEAGEVSGFQYPIYIRPTDGSPPIRLGEGHALSLSPDQKWALAGVWGRRSGSR